MRPTTSERKVLWKRWEMRESERDDEIEKFEAKDMELMMEVCFDTLISQYETHKAFKKSKALDKPLSNTQNIFLKRIIPKNI